MLQREFLSGFFVVFFFLYIKITDLTFPICLSFVLLLKSESPKISSNQLLFIS